MLSIVLFSAGNAPPLRNALASLRAQTARSTISRVIITQANRNEETNLVIREFADLPIAVEEGIAAKEEFDARIIGELRTPFVAFLREDDWWEVDRLQTSLAPFQSMADCVAVYGNFYETEGPSYPARSARAAWRVWLSSGCNFAPSAVQLDRTAATLATLLGRNLHLSTLVGRTASLKQALRCVPSEEGGYESDRILPLYLSSEGSIAYITMPKAFIRIPFNEASPAIEETSSALQSVTTRWILNQEPLDVREAVLRFNKVVENLPRVTSSHEAFPALPTIVHGITGRQWSTLVLECGLNLTQPDETVKDVSWFLKQICPPALFSLIQRRHPQLHPYAVRR